MKDVPDCDAVSRVIEDMVSELTVYAVTDVIDLFDHIFIVYPIFLNNSHDVAI